MSERNVEARVPLQQMLKNQTHDQIHQAVLHEEPARSILNEQDRHDVREGHLEQSAKICQIVERKRIIDFRCSVTTTINNNTFFPSDFHGESTAARCVDDDDTRLHVLRPDLLPAHIAHQHAPRSAVVDDVLAELARERMRDERLPVPLAVRPRLVVPRDGLLRVGDAAGPEAHAREGRREQLAPDAAGHHSEPDFLAQQRAAGAVGHGRAAAAVVGVLGVAVLLALLGARLLGRGGVGLPEVVVEQRVDGGGGVEEARPLLDGVLVEPALGLDALRRGRESDLRIFREGVLVELDVIIIILG